MNLVQLSVLFITLINISVARVIFLRMPAVDWILLRGFGGSVAE